MRNSEKRYVSILARAVPVSLVLITATFTATSGAEVAFSTSGHEMCMATTTDDAARAGEHTTPVLGTSVLVDGGTTAAETKPAAPVARLLEVQVVPSRIR